MSGRLSITHCLLFVDDDPKTAQIISEILLFAEDKKISDPFILQQIRG